MTITDTITLSTEEGHEVSLGRRDFDILTRWPRLDITRLVVVGEDAVHARRTDGSVHPQSLEDLLALAQVPAVLKAPEKSDAAPEKLRPGGLLDHFLKTGEARRTPAGSGGARQLPTVVIDGQPILLKAPIFEAGRVKVPVTGPESRDVVAWAYMPRTDFEALRRSPARPDLLAWRMGADGRPTTRIKRSPTDPYPQAVSDLMGELGLERAALVVEAVA